MSEQDTGSTHSKGMSATGILLSGCNGPRTIPDTPAMISADWITLRARIRASAMITGIRGMFTHSGPHGDKAYQAMLADAEGPSGYQS